MTTKDLSRTGLVTMDIKDQLPDSSEQNLVENPMGFIPSERASIALVSGQTEVNPLSVDLPNTDLMKSLTDYSGIDFTSTLQDPTDIGSSNYMTATTGKKDATTGVTIPDADTAGGYIKFEQQLSKAMGDKWLGSGAQHSADTYAGGNLLGEFDTSYIPLSFETTSDFVKGFKQEQVVGNTKEYAKKMSVYPPVNMIGAGVMVLGALKENALIKGVKNNPDKYMGNKKYIKDVEGWFAKQAQKQFGAIFEENPTSAIMIAEANKALYDYLQSTQEGRQKARDMGLSPDAMKEQTAKANAFKLKSAENAVSYSAYQGDTSSADGVASKKQAYTNMSKEDLNNNDPAGASQYKGMSIGGQGVFVDISDGIAPGTKFKSGTVFVKWKKEEREKRAKENKEKDKEKQAQQQQQQQFIQQSSQSTQDSYQQASGTGSSSSPKSKEPKTSGYQQATPKSKPSGYQQSFGGHHYNDGGFVNLQEGGPVPMGNPMGQQQPAQDAGNLELVQEQGKDTSGVADDVSRELAEGDFVINAPAMDMAGRGDIEQMVTKAIIELQRKGIKLDFGQTSEDIDSTVQALVSNKEMIIPKIIAEQIGYDRLEKINNRGKERVDEIEQEQQRSQQQVQQNPNPQGMMAVGGQVSLDENKNQPIAVPQESFAGQSSVGSKLLSPMSPEAQDDETELANKSQSFEGFMKPIKLANGGKIYNNPGNIEANTSASGVTPNETYDNGRFAVFNSKVEGLAAIPHTLALYGTNNVSEMVNIYKPPKENKSEEIKNTIDHIVKNLGKDTFDLTNQKDVYTLIEGITRFDSGVDSLKYYTPESMKTATDIYLKNTTTQNIQPAKTNKIVPKPKPDMMPIQQQAPVVQQQGMMGR